MSVRHSASSGIMTPGGNTISSASSTQRSGKCRKFPAEIRSVDEQALFNPACGVLKPVFLCWRWCGTVWIPSTNRRRETIRILESSSSVNSRWEPAGRNGPDLSIPSSDSWFFSVSVPRYLTLAVNRFVELVYFDCQHSWGCFWQIFSCSLSPAAPQSVLLLRLHHGRMPDSLYGNLSTTLQCN